MLFGYWIRMLFGYWIRMLFGYWIRMLFGYWIRMLFGYWIRMLFGYWIRMLFGYWIRMLFGYWIRMLFYRQFEWETPKVPSLFSRPASFSKSKHLEATFGFEVVYFFKFATFLEVFRQDFPWEFNEKTSPICVSLCGFYSEEPSLFEIYRKGGILNLFDVLSQEAAARK